MKKLTLFFCCTLFVVFGISQPTKSNFYEKFNKKTKFESLKNDKVSNYFYKENLVKEKKSKNLFSEKNPKHSKKILNFEKIKLFLSQKRETKAMNTNWWKPDTICIQSLWDDDERLIFQYKNGVRKNLLVQYKEEDKWEDYYYLTFEYDKNNNKIDLSSLPNGMYIANINGVNRKFLKQ